MAYEPRLYISTGYNIVSSPVSLRLIAQATPAQMTVGPNHLLTTYASLHLFCNKYVDIPSVKDTHQTDLEARG